MRLAIFLMGMILMTNNVQAKSVDFKKLTLPTSPNYYLVCPENFCNANPQQNSRVYSISMRELYQAWAKMIKKQERVTLNHIDEAANQYQYIQRSKIFRFPDYINVQFISLSEKSSTLAIYSRSKYGYSDMGVNKKRIMAWLKEIDRLIK